MYQFHTVALFTLVFYIRFYLSSSFICFSMFMSLLSKEYFIFQWYYKLVMFISTLPVHSGCRDVKLKFFFQIVEFRIIEFLS